MGLAWVVVLGFVRLMSNRRVLARPLSAPEAAEQCRLWLLQPNVRIVLPGPTHMDILSGLLAGPLGPNLVTDAHLAALAIEHQAELHSNDSDFARGFGVDLAQSDRLSPHAAGSSRIVACGVVP